jgi:hypothetical protein
LKFLLMDAVELTGTTGKSADALLGRTIDSAFPLMTITATANKLSGRALQALQARYASVKYVILDEFGMAGCDKLWQLSVVLTAIRPRVDALFGDFSVILCGDLGQLACVLQQPLFIKSVTARVGSPTARGHELFKQFTNVVWLRANHRQANDPQLRDALAGLKDGPLTEPQYDLFMTRVPGAPHSTVAAAQWASAKAFEHGVYWAATTTAEVTEINQSYLRQAMQREAPIAILRATQSRAVARLPASDFSGVASALTLFDGCVVQVRRNVCTGAGVVNGASGRVVAILFDETAHESALPRAVLVDLPSYRGPRFPHLPEGFQSTVIPLVPSKVTSGSGSARKVRLQVPLAIDAATTVHKLQGCTMRDRTLVVQLGAKEFSAGLTYVACSRTTRLSELIIALPVTHSRMAAAHSTKYHAARVRFEHLLTALDAATQQRIAAGLPPALCASPADLAAWRDVEEARMPQAARRARNGVMFPCPVDTCERHAPGKAYVLITAFVQHLQNAHKWSRHAAEAAGAAAQASAAAK